MKRLTAAASGVGDENKTREAEKNDKMKLHFKAVFLSSGLAGRSYIIPN
jgi:hypothetical protein